MLHNTNRFMPPIYRALNELESSLFAFYLTGSRFFGGEAVDSDWDFMVQDSPEVRAYLAGMGYDLIGKQASDYTDILVENVFRLHTGSDVGPSAIDIQLCNDIKRKLAVQRILEGHYGRGGFIPESKVVRKELWALAASAIEQLEANA